MKLLRSGYFWGAALSIAAIAATAARSAPGFWSGFGTASAVGIVWVILEMRRQTIQIDALLRTRN